MVIKKVGQSGLLVIFMVMNISEAFCLSPVEVYKRVEGSVFPVYGFNAELGQRTSAGAGVAVSKDLLATNCHIMENSDSFRIKINSELKIGNIVYQDINHDLCFLEVPDIVFTPVQFRKSQDVEVGEEVYAIGNPYGLEKSISRGIISNIHQYRGGTLLQTDATISFRSSGGGLFDVDGNLIGITRLGHPYKDIAFVVPSEWIIDLLNEAQSLRQAQGLNATISDQLKKHLGSKDLNIENIGDYGSDKVSLHRYQQQCFMAFKGVVNRTQSGIMLWYPQNHNIIYFIPHENTVINALRMMIKNGYVNQNTGSLSWDEKQHNSSLPMILQSREVITKKFDVNPQGHFSRINEVFLHYTDYKENFNEVQIRFGMLGFNKTYSILNAGEVSVFCISSCKASLNKNSLETASFRITKLLVSRSFLFRSTSNLSAEITSMLASSTVLSRKSTRVEYIYLDKCGMAQKKSDEPVKKK